MSGLDEDYKTDREEAASDSSQSEEEDDRVFDEVVRSSSASSKPSETPYIMCTVEELGQVRMFLFDKSDLLDVISFHKFMILNL